MTKILSASAVALILSTAAVFAGSPDNPAGHAELKNVLKDALQTSTGNNNAWGQAVKSNNQDGGPSVGQTLQAVKDAFGASPNPANDNGGGND